MISQARTIVQIELSTAKLVRAGVLSQVKSLVPGVKTFVFELPAHPATQILTLTLGGVPLTLGGEQLTIVGLA